MPDNRELRGSFKIDTTTAQKALKEVESFVRGIVRQFGAGNLTAAQQVRLQREIASFAESQFKKHRDINVHLKQADALVGAISKKWKLSYDELKRIESAAKVTNLHGGKLSELGDAWWRKTRSVSQWMERLREGTKDVVDESGNIVKRQTLMDKALLGLIGGFKDLIRYLLPMSALAGGFVIAIAKLFDYTMKIRAEAAQIYTKMGDIGRVGGIVLSQGHDLNDAIARLGWRLRLGVESARELIQTFVEGGAALSGMGDNITRIADRAFVIRAIQESTGVAINKQIELINTLQRSFAEVQESSIETSDGIELSTRESDKMAIRLAMTATEFANMGILSSDVYDGMLAIVKQADLLNIDYKNAVKIYTDLLRLKNADIAAGKGLAFLSDQNLQTLAEMATKASDLTLSSKAMIAAFAGRPFGSLIELEQAFVQPTESLKLLIEAARRPVQLMAGLLRPEDAELYLRLMQENSDHGRAMRRLTYDLYQSFLSQFGISYEMFDALVQGGETALAMEERIRSIETQAENLRPEIAEMVDRGAAIVKAAGGLEGLANIIATQIVRIANFVEGIFRLMPFVGGREREAEIAAKQLEIILKEYQAAVPEGARKQMETIVTAGKMLLEIGRGTVGQAMETAARGILKEEAKKLGMEIDLKMVADMNVTQVTNLIEDMLKKVQEEFQRKKATQQAQRTPPTGGPKPETIERRTITQTISPRG